MICIQQDRTFFKRGWKINVIIPKNTHMKNNPGFFWKMFRMLLINVCMMSPIDIQIFRKRCKKPQKILVKEDYMFIDDETPLITGW